MTGFAEGATERGSLVRIPNEEAWPNAFGLPAVTGNRLRQLIREANLFVINIRDQAAGVPDLRPVPFLLEAAHYCVRTGTWTRSSDRRGSDEIDIWDGDSEQDAPRDTQLSGHDDVD